MNAPPSPSVAHRRLVIALVLASGLLPVALRVAGVEAWFAPAGPAAAGAQALSLFEQWVAVLTGFVIKPAYMLLSLILIVVLWKGAGADLASLRWGLISCLAGEAFCAANYLLAGDGSDLLEFLHSWGMTLSTGFTAYALLEGLDYRLIRFSPEKDRCAALALCQACVKHTDAPCGLKRLFRFVLPAFIVVALLPLGAPLAPVSCRTCILGADYTYGHPVAYQVYELRYCPWLAVCLFTASWVALRCRRDHTVQLSKLLFAAGLGPFGFGLLRLFLFTAFADRLVWSNAWEELTELLWMGGVAWVLWVFRGSLFPAPAPTAAEP